MSEEMPEQFEKLFETGLEIDPSEAPKDEDELMLWDEKIKDCRFMLFKERTENIAGEQAGRDYYKLVFVCTVDLPHDLRIKWASLSINFKETKNLTIISLDPQNVTGIEPVELKSGISAEVTVPYITGVKLTPSVESHRKVFPPKITGSGLKSQEALWRFDPAEDGGVFLNHKLELEVSVPKGVTVVGYFNFKAHLARTGVLKFIPVFAVGKPIDETYRLTGNN